MKLKLSFIIVIIAVGVIVFVLLGDQPDKNEPIVQNLELVKLEQRRKQLDKTLWQDEVLAQEYEQLFIELSDRLRKHPDNHHIFKEYPFTKIHWGKVVEEKDIGSGITKRIYQGSEVQLTFQQWIDFIEEHVAKGYRLFQSEWHHEQFDNSSVPTVSQFSIELHLINILSPVRVIVKAKIKVEWGQEKNQTGNYQIKSIYAKKMEVFEIHKANVSFEEFLTIRPNENDDQYYELIGVSKYLPIILYDLNQDGLSEIILPNFNKIYWNRKQDGFKEQTLFDQEIGQIGTAIIAQFTRDSYADIFASRVGGFPVLFKGKKGGGFEQPILIELPEDYGDPAHSPISLTAGDIDGDGDLDIWMGQYMHFYKEGHMPLPKLFYDANDGYPSFLLINDGDGVFHDETLKRGLTGHRYRRTFTSSLIDLDHDQDLDLLTVNDFSGIDIYLNDGNGNFKEGTELSVYERAIFGMGHTFGDFNLDGRLDFYITGMSSTTAKRLEKMELYREGFPKHREMRSKMTYGNRMYVAGDVQGVYEKPPFADQVANTGWSWGATSFDIENDGDLDLYVANGFYSSITSKDYCTLFWRHDIHDVYEWDSENNPIVNQHINQNYVKRIFGGYSWNGFEHNYLLMSEQGNSFENIAFLLGVAFEYDARAVVSEDLDLDGLVDLIISDGHGKIHILRNSFSPSGNWIGVHLYGREGIPAIGAEITVYYQGGKKVERIVTGDSHHAQHSNQKHFGLGEINNVDSIEVVWPNGIVTKIEQPRINQYYKITPQR